MSDEMWRIGCINGKHCEAKYVETIDRNDMPPCDDCGGPTKVYFKYTVGMKYTKKDNPLHEGMRNGPSPFIGDDDIESY